MSTARILGTFSLSAIEIASAVINEVEQGGVGLYLAAAGLSQQHQMLQKLAVINLDAIIPVFALVQGGCKLFHGLSRFTLAYLLEKDKKRATVYYITAMLEMMAGGQLIYFSSQIVTGHLLGFASTLTLGYFSLAINASIDCINSLYNLGEILCRQAEQENVFLESDPAALCGTALWQAFTALFLSALKCAGWAFLATGNPAGWVFLCFAFILQCMIDTQASCQLACNVDKRKERLFLFAQDRPGQQQQEQPVSQQDAVLRSLLI